jgi:hypothetical protein
MNAVLTQRKYRLAARLATDTARTFGLYTVIAFGVLLAASLLWRQITGEYADLAAMLIFAVPLIVTVIAWAHLAKSYPLAIATGLTRKEFLAAYALFGLATVLVTALLTQLGLAVIDLFDTFRGVEHHMGFYGQTPLESVVRPALFFACGAAAAAAKLRFDRTWISAPLAAVVIAGVVYRSVAYFALMQLVGMENSSTDGTVFEYPNVDLSAVIPYLDAVLAAVFALIAWALLARAPMRPKAN